MKNKTIPAGLALLLAHGLLAVGQPNIIFIITDDMYPWQMNFMPEGEGQNYSPNLDRLANEGTVMRNQYVSSTVCTPSRYSCMTGRYASRSQDPAFTRVTEELGQSHIQWNSFADPTREKTIAHHLRDAGYRTGFVGKDHVILTPGRKHLKLSDDADDPRVKKIMKQNATASKAAYARAGFEYAERIYHNNPDFNGSRQLAVHNQDWITEGALEFLGKDDERPFFLYFATTIPHGPTEEDRSWNADRRATPEGWLEHPPKVQPDAVSIVRRSIKNKVEGKETIIWIDDAIGELLKKLEETGELENTIIFFFNDHGQSAKGSVYQGGAYNPSVVWKKGGWPVGSDAHALVSNIDFVPTILDMAGAPAPDNVDGVSFLPVLEDETDSIRDSLFFEMGYTRAVLKDGVKYIALRYPPSIANMTREQRQAKLDWMNNNLRDRGRPVHTEDPMAPFGHLMEVPGGHDAEQGAVRSYPHYYEPDQLYDIGLDPNERNNLINDPKYLEKAVDLKRTLQTYLDTLPGDFPL
ncbi:MAG: sulfatase [Puniceicoccaceae bacterium]